MSRRPKPSTGYSGEAKRRPLGKVWSCIMADQYLHGKLAAVIRCDDEPRGLIQLEDEDEFKWLNARLTGTQLPPTT